MTSYTGLLNFFVILFFIYAMHTQIYIFTHYIDINLVMKYIDFLMIFGSPCIASAFVIRGKGDYQIDYTPAPRITEADKNNDRGYNFEIFTCM